MAMLKGMATRIRMYFTGDGWQNEIRWRLMPAIFIILSVSAVFGWLMYQNKFFQIEAKMLDLRFSFREVRTPSISDPVIILAIDDESLSALKLSWPIPRGIYGRVVSRLSEAGAKVVAFDFTFAEESPAERSEQDRLLGDAIAKSRSWVVLAGKFRNEEFNNRKFRSFLSPTTKIDTTRTHVGFVDVWKDEDGVLRRAVLLQFFQKKVYPSFAMKVLDRYLGLDINRLTVWKDRNLIQYDKLFIPAEQGIRMIVNFRGGAGSFRTISLINILTDENQVFENIKKLGIFKDKIVLVGPTFAEGHDLHSTPYSTESGSQTPGVEFHANIIDTILNRNFYWELPKVSSIVWIVLLVMLCTLITIRLRPFLSPIILALIIVFIWVFVFFAFNQWNLIMPLFLPTMALIVATLSTMIYRVLVEERRGHQIKAMFSRYVSPKVVEELVKNPKGAITLGGNKQIVTVLFSDIRNFTTMSEQLKPEQVVELLNEYFQDMTDVIFSHDGTVDKFIGDAIMAVFGAPVEHEDDPLRAVKSGLDMLKALEALNALWAKQGKRTIAIGVGVNTGEAIVGNMGSTQAMGYTVIGDTVNLASRLEGLNKELKTSLLISENTYRYIRDHVEVKAYPGVKVKGKAEEMTVYEVLGLKA